jgi:hypothetical protein
MTKYRAQPVVIDGIRFASKGESTRWHELKLMERAGLIVELDRQRRFRLNAEGGQKVGEYVADFTYRQRPGMQFVVEDYKGFPTPLYLWKRRHFEAQYGIKITEVRAKARAA